MDKALQQAAQAVLDRWNSPTWEWHKQGPTADLMHALQSAIAQPVQMSRSQQQAMHHAAALAENLLAQPEQPALQPLTEQSDLTVRTYESLLKACVFQLRAWNQKYGQRGPSWLPPGVEVQLLETIDDWLNSAQLRAAHTAQPVPAGNVITCAWIEQDDDEMPGTYASACGEMWSFVDGGVAENNVRFCHGCGKPVAAHNAEKD